MRLLYFTYVFLNLLQHLLTLWCKFHNLSESGLRSIGWEPLPVLKRLSTRQFSFSFENLHIRGRLLEDLECQNSQFHIQTICFHKNSISVQKLLSIYMYKVHFKYVTYMLPTWNGLKWTSPFTNPKNALGLCCQV